MATINILGKKYLVSKQAQYTYYAGLVSLFFGLMMNFNKGGMKNIKILQIVVVCLSISLSTYATNCVVKGGCNEYAWFLTIMSVLSTVMVLSGSRKS